MTLQTAYSQTLNADVSLSGGDYAYAVPVPLSAGGAAVQVVLQAPSVGSMTVSDIWVGKLASGHAFVPGSQVRASRLGQYTFTGSAGQDLALDATPMTVNAGDTLLVVCDLHGGSGMAYRRKSVSGMSYGYTGGQQNAANGNDTRSFTSLASYTALVKAVVVGDVADFGGTPQPPPPPDPEDDDPVVAYPWFNAIKTDQLYSSGKVFGGVAGEHLVVGLFNPEGSGREVFLHQIDINADADTVATIHADSGATSWPIVPSRCNLDFRNGSPASVAKVHSGSLTSVPIGLHAFKKLKGGVDGVLNKTPYPMVRIAPGYGGMILVLHTPSVGATINFHWQEIPV